MSTENRVDTSNKFPPHGSSTGPSGAQPGRQDRRSQYDRSRTGYNPSTGAGYSTTSAGGQHQHHHQHASSPDSYDQAAGQDDRIQHAPSTAQRARAEEESQGASSSTVSQVSEDLGRSVKGTLAGIHGAGESVRGTFNAAVDRAFGTTESAKKNEAIASKGERQVRTGEFASESGNQ